MGRSRSRSRLGLKIKCLGLVSVSHHRVSFTSQCAQLFAFIAKLHLHRFECKASILLLIHKFTYLLQCKCISRCHLVRMYGSAQATLCYMGTQYLLSGAQQPTPIFGPCLFCKNDRPSQLLMSTCHITSDTFLHDSTKLTKITEMPQRRRTMFVVARIDAFSVSV